MLTNPSQLIIRNDHLFNETDVLLLNHEGDTLARELLDQGNKVTALALDFNHHLQLAGHKYERLRSYFGHELPTDARFDWVVLFYPKSKSLASYLINLAAIYLKQGRQLLIVGENKGGVRSVVKQLPDYFNNAVKLDNARHCALFGTVLEGMAPKIVLDDWVSRYQLMTPQGTITICNLVGVFSEKRLDDGTKLLLEHLPKLSGKVLDFGCGAGVITAALLKANDQLDIECVDINAMALISCQLTLAANEMTAAVYPSDGLAQTNGNYDAIIANPPFHDGLSQTTSIASRFIQTSVDKLKPSGQWNIVANRHLPYHHAIEQHFSSVHISAENKYYKIYSALSPKHPSD